MSSSSLCSVLYLASLSMVFLLVCTEQLCQPKVCDFHMLRSLDKDVPGSKVTVHQAPFLQIVHSLQCNTLLVSSPWYTQVTKPQLLCGNHRHHHKHVLSYPACTLHLHDVYLRVRMRVTIGTLLTVTITLQEPSCGSRHQQSDEGQRCSSGENRE